MRRPLCLLSALLLLAPADAAAQLAQRTVELPTADHTLAVRAQTLFTIGRDDGTGPDVFGSIDGVAFGANGALYVLDGMNARVVVFDSTGRYLRHFGRRGRGPGEFARAAALAVTRSGSVVVRDGARGYHVFDSNGVFRHFLRHSITPPPAGRLRVGDDEAVFTGGVGFVFDGGQPRGLDHAPVMRQSLAATAAPETVLRLPAPTTRITGSVAPGGAGMTIDPGLRVGETEPLWAPLPGGRVAFVAGGRYELGIARGSEIIMVVTRAQAPRPLTGRDRAAVREKERAALSAEGLRRSAAGGGQATPLPRAEVEKRLNELRFAERVAPVAGLAVDAAARLWIARAGSPLTEPGPIDVLDSELRYLGTLQPQPLPDAFGPGGRAAYIDRDEYDIARVVVRRFTGF